ncbi:uracil-DNA glycosylase [Halofilum ochraceum]|uniref:uracil-DNA glycosylase n=1 Tax=Halofilum ochraceum TaxID=1611323 RepID=UPI0008D96B39|nr:uracil-DNA glycosylase [Halofilum ochraceum]
MNHRDDRDRTGIAFDPGCRACPRLAAHLDAVRARHPDYHCAPVPAFGDPDARLLIVGLAPGEHGANATGRPFTGDYAGQLLYSTLYAFGFANAPVSSTADDDLRLTDCRITNAVKCLPPGNKPTGAEVRECNGFLQAEIAMQPPSVLLALGRVAHDATLRALGLRQRDHVFGHAAVHRPEGLPVLIDSYHCSRYNTQTRRLTESMFHDVFRTARAHL